MTDLARTEENLFKMPPLTWRIVRSQEVGGGPAKEVPIMRDSCGDLHHARLDAWDIADDGTVTPSVHFLDCGWHDFVRLVGWPAPPQEEGTP